MGIALALTLAFLHSDVRAQPSESEGALALEEIIVTARRRAESLQEIPLSIVPFQAEQLQRRDIQTVEDIATGTIGLIYNGGTSSGVQGSVTLRGLATNFVQDRFQNVGIYLDGIYLQRQSMANIGMVDLARVEIVKGPQNALYGRNAFAGAINYVTQKPSHELEAYLLTTQGSDERQDYRGALSGPLLRDKLYGRLAWGISKYDGANENPHPLANADISGFHNENNLGGWDDQTYSLALQYNPIDNLELGASYYRTEIKREFQSNYVLAGLREISVFGLTQYDDLNFNEQTLDVYRGGAPAVSTTANTLWQGELPTAPGPGQYRGASTCPPPPVPCSTPAPTDNAVFGAVDPRGYGAIADTDLYSFNLAWAINDYWNLKYQFGDIEHESLTGGEAARDALAGSSYFVGIGRAGAEYIYSSDFSSRPISFVDQQSHELRVSWDADRFRLALGAYYSKTDDEQYDLTVFAPVCSDRDVNGDGSNADEIANCNLAIPTEPRAPGAAPLVPSALAQATTGANTALINFWDTHWNGRPTNHSQFEDEVTSVFAEFDYELTEALTLRAELRYTIEDRTITRLAGVFGLAPGETGTGSGMTPRLDFSMGFPPAPVLEPLTRPGPMGPVPVIGPDGQPVMVPAMDSIEHSQDSSIEKPEDDETFNYATGRLSIDWAWRENSLLYAYIANGIKSGGFNNTESSSDLTYDEEENYTLEIGSKNTLFDNRLSLNATLFYVDWQGLQGSLAPISDSQNANVVTGNIGDATNLGFEIESSLRLSPAWSIDLAYTWTRPEYENGTEYDAARRHYYYQCNQEGPLVLEQGRTSEPQRFGPPQAIVPPRSSTPLCGNADVGGNQLARTADQQAIGAINYRQEWFDGWDASARLEGSWQSKQYLTPLNVGFIASRTLYNGTVNITSPEARWDITFWGKNLTNEKYVQSQFTLSLFNRYLVALGQRRSWGTTVRYSF